MSNHPPLGVAILGCGNIAGPYADDFTNWSNIALVGCCDADPARAEAFAAKYGITAYPNLAAMLADPEVAIVANLTTHAAHYETTAACLRAGKHVHSEKPLADTSERAWELVALADELGLRLGCSPFTWLGPGQTAIRQMVSEGKLGTVRAATAEALWGCIERWHPEPASFYRVGGFADVSPYAVTMLTRMFGPVRKVSAYGKVVKPQRTDQQGRTFQVEKPDWVVANLETDSGVPLRVTVSYWAGTSRAHAAMEIFGDEGTVRTEEWAKFGAKVEHAPVGGEWQTLDLPPFEGYVQWALGLADMATAIREGTPHQATGRHGAHLVDIIEAVYRSIETGQSVEVTSDWREPAR